MIRLIDLNLGYLMGNHFDSQKNMKLVATVFLLLILSVVALGQGRGFELTKDNPSTLISTNSASYTVFGFRLGMSQPEAQRVLAQHKMLSGQQDAFNPS